MVYVQGEIRDRRKARKQDVGKLISISAPEKAVIDRNAGVFRFIRLAIVNQQDGKDVWYNFTVFSKIFGEPLNMQDFPELQKADELLSQGVKPLVQFRFFEQTEVDTDKLTGEQKIVKKTKMSYSDINEHFKILGEAGDTPVLSQLVDESQPEVDDDVNREVVE